jgi:DNA-binding CsgD family transcriptional regulator
MTNEPIGRDAEVAIVRQFLDRPSDGPRALVLEGEAGIGKSTIWLAAVAAARERSFKVLASRPAETERSLAHVVLGDLFSEVEPGMLATLPAPRRRAFESALLREATDLPIDPRALGVAIHGLLPMLADGRPLVLAVDDDQWMDPSSAATLEFALRRLGDESILLLLARRSNTNPEAALENVVESIKVERLVVGPLSIGAVQAVLGDRLGVSVPRPVLLRLVEASGGNPFHVLELARARANDPDRDLTAPMAVPPSLERLLAARLGALAPPTRDALLLLAAHGRMPVALLAALEIGDESLEPARAARVIVTVADVVSFTHPLLASAAYQGASSQERQAAHARLAAAIDDPVERGRHFAHAVDEPSDPFAAELESAASTARDRGMPLAGAELLDHAVRLTPHDAPADRHRRALAAARAHLEAGGGARARAIAAEALARAAPGAETAEALVLGSELEDVGDAVRLLEQALGEAGGAPALEASIHARLGEAGRATQGRAWAEQHTRAALELVEELDDEPLRAKLLLTLAQDRFEGGDPGALELVEGAHELVTSLAHPHRAGWADTKVGWVLTFSAEFDRARAWLEERLDYWRDRDEQMRSELLWLLALTEVWSGRWTIASDYAAQVREISVQYHEVSTDHLSPALIALHRGQIDIARGHSQRALALARGHLLPQHKAILGVCDLWSGNPGAALAHFVDAEQTADIRGWDEANIRWWRADYADTLLQLARIEEAGRFVADWEVSASRAAGGRARAQVLRCRGLLAAAQGEVVTAIELLELAADRHEASGDPFNRARALLALGVARLRARQKRDARVAFEAALAGFESLGAAGWAEATRSEIARVGGRERIEGLSPSERRVAELAAEGQTNREIAATLFLGERTVASHLTHVYAKLGIRSRTELARHLIPMPVTASSPGPPTPPRS